MEGFDDDSLILDRIISIKGKEIGKEYISSKEKHLIYSKLLTRIFGKKEKKYTHVVARVTFQGNVKLF